MKNQYAITILRNFEHKLNPVRNDNVHKQWKWKHRVVLFPEGKCPYCKKFIRSNRIWWLQGDHKLLGQFKISQGRLVKESPDHPHVQGGTICLGNARNPMMALFAGLNPKTAYTSNPHTWNEWLKGKWLHDCVALR